MMYLFFIEKVDRRNNLICQGLDEEKEFISLLSFYLLADYLPFVVLDSDVNGSSFGV